jgi:hypothetical protein
MYDNVRQCTTWSITTPVLADSLVTGVHGGIKRHTTPGPRPKDNSHNMIAVGPPRSADAL